MIEAWLGEEREAYVLGLLRVCFATLLGIQTGRRALELLRDGYFGDVFHLPVWPAAWVPSAPVYAGLLALQLLGCALSLVGVASRQALGGAALLGLFFLFCDRLQFHNNRYQLLLLALLVAVTPCDRAWRLFGRRERQAGLAPRWSAKLVAAQVSLVYLASSLGKLFDADWRGGSVLTLRIELARPITERYLPHALVELLAQPWVGPLGAALAISSELFLALGLWFPRTRVLALWLGVAFHVGIEVSARVELFSYTMLCAYLVFVTPELQQRRLALAAGSFWASWLERLDVLRRFQHERAPSGSAFSVTDRAGTQHHGLSAWRELARAFPPLFPLWLPLSLASWRPRRRSA